MAQAITQATILLPQSNSDGKSDPTEKGWEIFTRDFDPLNASKLPDKCYIFLHKDGYPQQDHGREELLNDFGVPVFVANRACTELNGYFGCKATYNQNEVAACSTWFRCLIKMVIKEKDHPYGDEQEYVRSAEDVEKGYAWFEMGIFTFWGGEGKCRVLCVDAPDDLPGRLKTALERRQTDLDFRDPLAMHTDLLDQIILYYEIAVWRVRDPVRKLEKARLHLKDNIFIPIHDVSRHAIHTTEVLTATIETMKEFQRYQINIYEHLPAGLMNHKEQAKAYTDFQIQVVKSLKIRSESNQKRLENEINLAFNNLAHQDNTVMKSIALLTMVFLPATFFSALFSTTFFTFGENGWEASSRLWIYWVITVPVTVVVLSAYRVWMRISELRDGRRTRSWNANHP